jgi:exonuclease SbcD
MSLLADQQYVLEQFREIAWKSKPDLIVVAGDVFDRPVPSKEAVALVNEVLRNLVLSDKHRVLMIAGNHDSATRLSFTSDLLESSGLYIQGPVSQTPRCVPIVNGAEGLTVVCLPYVNPFEVKSVTNGDGANITGADSAVAYLLGNLPPSTLDSGPCVLVGHAFVAGGEVSGESERPISVGGIDAVSLNHFDPFCYVALGHLHRPQTLGDRSHIRYAGSLLKYSFDEEQQTKSVSLVTIDPAGGVTVEAVPLSPRHDVRRIEGAFDEMLSGDEKFGCKDDYLMATYTDSGIVLDARPLLCAVYPNLVGVSRAKDTSVFGPTAPTQPLDRETDDEIFAQFFRDMTGSDWDDEHRQVFLDTISRASGELDQ